MKGIYNAVLGLAFGAVVGSYGTYQFYVKPRQATLVREIADKRAIQKNLESYVVNAGTKDLVIKKDGTPAFVGPSGEISIPVESLASYRLVEK